MTPGGSSGSSSFFRRPGLALAIAAAAVAAGILIALVFRPPSGPIWLASAIAVLVVSAPAVVATIAAPLVAGQPGLVRRVLLHARWTDLVWGVSTGLLLRAVVELVEPTGSLRTGFVILAPVDIIVIALGAALVTPIVEELFFRGVLAGATADAARSLGRLPAAAVAIAVSTAAFVLLHVLSAGAATTATVLVPLLVSVATGILFLVTRRLAAPIVAHVVFNTIGVALMLA